MPGVVYCYLLKKKNKGEDKNMEQNMNYTTDSDSADSIITLTGDDGKDVDYELLDMIALSGKNYAVVLPASEDADKVEIFLVKDAEKDTNTFVPVSDRLTAMTVFNLFKEKNREFFDFE